MTELFGHIVNVVLPIALCVLVGTALAVLKLPFDRKMIGALVQNVGYPALVRRQHEIRRNSPRGIKS